MHPHPGRRVRTEESKASAYLQINRISYRTGFQTLETSNALGRSSVFRDCRYIHRTFIVTAPAAGTAVSVNGDPDQGNLVGDRQDCPQRTQVLTGETLHEHR